jgi:flagellar protein FliO/FliZ
VTAQAILLVLGALVGVVVLIGIVARFFQFLGGRAQSRPGRTLILRESIAIDPRRRIHLVQCGQRQVILLTGGGQDLIIGWMQDR